MISKSVLLLAVIICLMCLHLCEAGKHSSSKKMSSHSYNSLKSHQKVLKKMSKHSKDIKKLKKAMKKTSKKKKKKTKHSHGKIILHSKKTSIATCVSAGKVSVCSTSHTFYLKASCCASKCCFIKNWTAIGGLIAAGVIFLAITIAVAVVCIRRRQSQSTDGFALLQAEEPLAGVRVAPANTVFGQAVI